MDDVREHLTDGQLEGYARRTLSAADLLATDAHLAECSACRARLQDPTALTRLISGLAGHLVELVVRVPRKEKHEIAPLHLGHGGHPMAAQQIHARWGRQFRGSPPVLLDSSPRRRERSDLFAWRENVLIRDVTLSPRPDNVLDVVRAIYGQNKAE